MQARKPFDKPAAQNICQAHAIAMSNPNVVYVAHHDLQVGTG